MARDCEGGSIAQHKQKPHISIIRQVVSTRARQGSHLAAGDRVISQPRRGGHCSWTALRGAVSRGLRLHFCAEWRISLRRNSGSHSGRTHSGAPMGRAFIASVVAIGEGVKQTRLEQAGPFVELESASRQTR